MKAGDIVFVHGKGIVSWLIRKVSKGEYNHCAIAISDQLVFESEWNSGVRIRNINAYKKKGAEIKVIPMEVTEKQVNHLYQICNSYVSAKFYDWKQITKLFFKYTLHINFKWKNTRQKVICSELCAMVMLDTGMVNDYNIIDFSPQELHDWLVNQDE